MELCNALEKLYFYRQCAIYELKHKPNLTQNQRYLLEESVRHYTALETIRDPDFIIATITTIKQEMRRQWNTDGFK